MALDRQEVRRLGVMQKYPLRHFERRTETIEIINDTFARVVVDLQIEFPIFDDDETDENNGVIGHTMYVPLGFFNKHRIPDVQVFTAEGARLPVLTRFERSAILASTVTAEWHERIFGDLPSDVASLQSKAKAGAVPPATADETAAYQLACWKVLQQAIHKVVYSPADAAFEYAEQFMDTLQKLIVAAASAGQARLAEQLSAIYQEQDLVERLSGFAETTVAIALMDAFPGDTYILHVKYTERLSDAPHEHAGVPLTAGVGPMSRAWARLERGLTRWGELLALAPTPVHRYVSNAGKAQSLWIVADLQPGVEPVRFHWTDEVDAAERPDGFSIDCDRAVVHWDGRAKKRPEKPVGVLLEAQVEPTGGVGLAFALTAFIFFVATFIYRTRLDPKTFANLSTVAGIFAALPAALVGGLVYRGQAFARHVSRGPRGLISILAGLTSLLAAAVGLQRTAPFANALAYYTSLYAFFTAGVLAYIQVGPRYRKNGRSRRPHKTDAMSTAKCWQRQRRGAAIFLVVLMLLTIAVGQAQWRYQNVPWTKVIKFE